MAHAIERQPAWRYFIGAIWRNFSSINNKLVFPSLLFHSSPKMNLLLHCWCYLKLSFTLSFSTLFLLSLGKPSLLHEERNRGGWRNTLKWRKTNIETKKYTVKYSQMKKHGGTVFQIVIKVQFLFQCYIIFMVICLPFQSPLGFFLYVALQRNERNKRQRWETGWHFGFCVLDVWQRQKILACVCFVASIVCVHALCACV